MLTYAGQNLLLEDQAGLLGAWLEQYLPLEDVRSFGTPPGLISERRESRTTSRAACGLPTTNDPDPPRLKVNSLFWPTGASRWARFYGLVDSNTLDELSFSSPAPLVLTDQDNGLSITADLWLIDARPLSAATGAIGVSLITLVDDRYWWQTKDAGELLVSLWNGGAGVITWAAVYAALGAALGVGIAVDSISAAYAAPDPFELTRPYESAAVLLDAAAASLGQRIVRSLAGSVSAQNFSSGVGVAQGNLTSLTPALLAGGSMGGSAPAETLVTFQRYFQGAIDPTGQTWPVTLAASGYSNGPTVSAGKTIHSCALADFSNSPDLFDAGAPQNAGEVQSLAAQIASDYYAAQNVRYDATFTSLRSWTANALDDWLEWCFGRRQAVAESDEIVERLNLADRGAYQCYTRASSRPLNSGVEEQLSQFLDTPVYPSPTRFQLQSEAVLLPLDEPSPEGQSARAFHCVFNQSDESWSPTQDQLTVWDVFNQFPVLPGQCGYATYNADSLRWEILEVDNRFLQGVLDADLEPGESAQVTLWQGLSATPYSVEAWDWPGSGETAGTKVFVRWCVDSSRWYVLAAASKPVLGKTEEDVTIGNSVGVQLYRGAQGEEEENNQAITAYNKFIGAIPAGTWVWCQNDGDGLYIVTDSIQGRALGVCMTEIDRGKTGTVSIYIDTADAQVDVQAVNLLCTDLYELDFVWVMCSPDSTPERYIWYVVASSRAQFLLGKTQPSLAIAFNSTVQVEIYQGPAGEETATGITVTAVNKGWPIPAVAAGGPGITVECAWDGERWYIVRDEIGPDFFSVNNEGNPWAKNSSQMQTVYTGGPPGTLSQWQVDVYNAFGDIPYGKRVWCAASRDGWYVIAAEC